MGKRLVIGLLVLLAVGLGIYWYRAVPKQSVIELPVPREVTVGSEFRVPLQVDVPTAINAGEFYFTFPPDLLEVSHIDQGGSFYQLWITGYPKFDNANGRIELAGGLPKPGFQGENGLVATIVFKAKQPGRATIQLDEGKSRLLANDGQGTEVVSRFRPAILSIK